MDEPDGFAPLEHARVCEVCLAKRGAAQPVERDGRCPYCLWLPGSFSVPLVCGEAEAVLRSFRADRPAVAMTPAGSWFVALADGRLAPGRVQPPRVRRWPECPMDQDTTYRTMRAVHEKEPMFKGAEFTRVPLVELGQGDYVTRVDPDDRLTRLDRALGWVLRAFLGGGAARA